MPLLIPSVGVAAVYSPMDMDILECNTAHSRNSIHARIYNHCVIRMCTYTTYTQ